VNVHQDFEEALKDAEVPSKYRNDLPSDSSDGDDEVTKPPPARTTKRPPLAAKDSQAQVTVLGLDGKKGTSLEKVSEVKLKSSIIEGKDGTALVTQKKTRARAPPSVHPVVNTIRDSLAAASPTISDYLSSGFPPPPSARSNVSAAISISSSDSGLSHPVPPRRRAVTTRKLTGKRARRPTVISLSSEESDRIQAVEVLDNEEDDEVTCLGEKLKTLHTSDVFDDNEIEVVKDPLESLLAFCDQVKATSFTEFINSHDFIPLATQTSDGVRQRRTRVNASKSASSNTPEVNTSGGPSTYVIKKVGEASYSEVYGVSRSDSAGEDLVLKVVPLSTSEHKINASENGDDEICTSTMQDVLRELEITKLMTDVGPGLATFRGSAWSTHRSPFPALIPVYT
jgi:hypothetical protein